MSDLDKSIIELIEKLSEKMTHEELYHFAVQFLQHVEDVMDVDYETESESEEDDRLRGYPEDDFEYDLDGEGFYSLK